VWTHRNDLRIFRVRGDVNFTLLSILRILLTERNHRSANGQELLPALHPDFQIHTNTQAPRKARRFESTPQKRGKVLGSMLLVSIATP
jgi:hypothetical protein